MQAGYLLDTNIISYWLDEMNQRHEAVLAKVRQCDPESRLLTSVVALGEIEDGIARTSGAKHGVLADFRRQVLRQFVEKRFLVYISKSTAFEYGRLRAELFKKFAPKTGRAKRPEDLIDPVTSKELGIQENDLWIAAQAIERNLILVTNDAMAHIRQVAPELRVENWAVS